MISGIGEAEYILTEKDQWDVPKYEERTYREKSAQYALVIPVINEGERIRRQLSALCSASYSVDIVIADGGSTDSSLDESFLRSVNVNTLLIKQGTGRLGAQLRMAYSWCLERGYVGIITVDGNEKDGLDAIPQFIQKLNQGYDYVQGSRYLPGGQAVNTPVDRWLAGRLVHAPIVSASSGFRFTDTTNGFRAYSAKALSDRRVAPFRSIFCNYELLFYLSIRLPKLGFEVVEIPVARKYPRETQTPTKIKGLKARMGVMRELIGAAAGRYDPK